MALDSPVFSPQQHYLIGYMQDSWRATDRLTLELGLRYDFYSVVKEKNGNAKPFFIEENDFSSDPDNFYNPDKNNFAPRLSAVYRIDDKTVFRTGFGLFYGPGQFEDRIQPIENAIERRRLGAADVPNNGLAYPVPPSSYLNALSIRGYTHNRPDEYNMQYGASVSRELPGAVNFTIGYTGSRGKDMFLRGVANTLDFNTRARQQPTYGQIDYKTSGCVDGLVINNQAISGCGRASYDALQLSATRRFRAGFTGGVQYQVLEEQGHDAGLERGGDFAEHVRLRDRVRHQPAGHPAHVQRLAGLPHSRARVSGAAAGAWAASSTRAAACPSTSSSAARDNATVNGATVTNIPGGNSRGTQRPDVVPGVDPYLKDGVRWLNPAAFTTPQPGTFGNLPRNALRGPEFVQLDMMFSKDFQFAQRQSFQFRVEIFNLMNRLNYENPAASLPGSGAPGVPFTDAQAGTFGYMLGPLNRTVGLGTARQTQISLRYSF